MLVVCVIVAGLFIGANNTLITETVMSGAGRAAGRQRGYSFVRFGGGAVAPCLAGKLGEEFNSTAVLGRCRRATLVGVVVLSTGKSVLAHIDDGRARCASGGQAAPDRRRPGRDSTGACLWVLSCPAVRGRSEGGWWSGLVAVSVGVMTIRCRSVPLVCQPGI